MILGRVVAARFGPRGLYSFLARHDPDVRAAAERIPEAASLLEPRR